MAAAAIIGFSNGLALDPDKGVGAGPPPFLCFGVRRDQTESEENNQKDRQLLGFHDKALLPRTIKGIFFAHMERI